MEGFLRIKGVMELTGLGRSTIYLMISEGRFPRQVKLSARCVGWYLKSLQIWIYDRLHEGSASQSDKGEADDATAIGTEPEDGPSDVSSEKVTSDGPLTDDAEGGKQ